MVNNFELNIAKDESFAFDSEMLCLTDRREEFKKAAERADQSKLYVFFDAPDRFGVVNRESNVNYGVSLKSAGGRIYADCECADFIYRKRLCKHIAAVVDEVLFG